MRSFGKDLALTAMLSSLWILGSSPSYIAGGGLGGALSAAFYLISGNMSLYLISKLTYNRILPLASALSVGVVFLVIPPAAGYGVFLFFSNIILGLIYTLSKNIYTFSKMLPVSILAGGVSGVVVTLQFAILRGSLYLVFLGFIYGVLIAPIGFSIGYIIYSRLQKLGVA